MPELFTVSVNKSPVQVESGVSVAVAILRAGVEAFRHSVTGEARGPLCGMGICFECRVTLDGVPQSRSCQILCRPGMRIETT